MKYLLSIYHAEGTGPQPGTPEFGEMMQGYMAFDEEITQRDMKLGGEPLEDVSAASTVRIRNGKVEITDGPFAETKEVLGGFYLLECNNLDEALELAAKIPTAEWGSIEVRPVMDLSKLM